MTTPIRHLLPAAAVTLALALALSSCSTNRAKVTSTPVAGSPTAARATLENSSEQVLRRDQLWRDYRKDPESAIRALHLLYQNDGGADRLRTVAELCGTLGSERESQSPLSAIGCYLDAARLSRSGALRNRTTTDQELRLIYNVSCASLTSLAHLEFAKTKSLATKGPLQAYQLSLGSPGKGSVDPGRYAEIIPADRLKFSRVNLPRTRQDGIGGALVAHRPQRESISEDEKYISPAGYAIPVNASLDFPGGDRARLLLRDTLKVDHVSIGGQRHNLAADWGASIGYLYRYAPPLEQGFFAMLRPDKYAQLTGLYELHPFDSDKIPVVLVHGLLSSPQTWTAMVVALRTDPVLRQRYQAIVFKYPSGYAISRNASTLREALKEYQARYDSPRTRSKINQMVLIGHSMGGILSNLQIRESGDKLEKTFFTEPIAKLDAPEETKSRFRELYLFSPNPRVRRAIFLAAPHRGSDLAINPIGKFGASLIKLPGDILKAGLEETGLLDLGGLTDTARDELKAGTDGIHGLQPSSPFLKAVDTMPAGKRIVYHSIIGRADPKTPLLESDDKWVPYWSSHLDGAASEKVIHTTHTKITANPEAIEEVRRILYLHLGLPAPTEPLSLDQ